MESGEIWVGGFVGWWVCGLVGCGLVGLWVGSRVEHVERVEESGVGSWSLELEWESGMCRF